MSVLATTLAELETLDKFWLQIHGSQYELIDRKKEIDAYEINLGTSFLLKI
ncbi:hypothetical protein HMI54_002675 [Coelomomyces lativittatus]|nr:hypothetical protein HMI54_002675 [Coelomomyces lativittatus]KAJ1509552.1 hypothetical protein HMI55_007344 [Coelomomyces lativittatus]